MADIQTTYLGLKLHNPLIVSSGPLTNKADQLKDLEDAGVSAVVMRSIFEEQITAEIADMYSDLENETSAFAMEYLRADLPAQLGPESYLKKIEEAKKRVKIPIIASCNCLNKDKWIAYAKKVEQAGADALELNLYHMPIDPNEDSAHVEMRNLDLV